VAVDAGRVVARAHELASDAARPAAEVDHASRRRYSQAAEPGKDVAVSREVPEMLVLGGEESGNVGAVRDVERGSSGASSRGPSLVIVSRFSTEELVVNLGHDRVRSFVGDSHGERHLVERVRFRLRHRVVDERNGRRQPERELGARLALESARDRRRAPVPPFFSSSELISSSIRSMSISEAPRAIEPADSANRSISSGDTSPSAAAIKKIASRTKGPSATVSSRESAERSRMFFSVRRAPRIAAA